MLLSSPSKSFDHRRASTIHFIWSVSTYLEHFSLVHLFAAAVSSHVVLLPYATETVARLQEKTVLPLDSTNTSSTSRHPIPAHLNRFHLLCIQKMEHFFRLFEIPNRTMLGARTQ